MIRRELLESDLEYLMYDFRLREDDYEELGDMTGENPYKCLVNSIELSQDCSVLCDNENNIFCVFGSVDLGNRCGRVWMLANNAFDNHRLYALKEARKQVAEWLSKYTVIGNMCSLKNEKSIKFLEWLGFTFDTNNIVCGNNHNTNFIMFTKY